MTNKSAKKWLAVSFTCPENLVEAVSDQLGVMSGSGVEIRPIEGAHEQLITGFFELGEVSSVTDIEAASTQVLEKVTGEVKELFAIYDQPLPDLETRILEDEDWATSWQQFFTAKEIVPGLVIKPSWEEYSPTSGQHVIKMDPGMAFGTGQHSSTRLALLLISSCFAAGHDKKPGRVLDIGTGTGILAIASANYGADQVMAIDTDPDAVTIAQHNVQANHVDWNIGISTRPLDDLQGTYDLICANIVHDVLVDMAPDINRLTAHKGHIILSGILSGEQESNITRVYLENDMKLVRTEYEEEWVSLLLQKSS